MRRISVLGGEGMGELRIVNNRYGTGILARTASTMIAAQETTHTMVYRMPAEERS